MVKTGADLRVEQLVSAYGQSLFDWQAEPIKWAAARTLSSVGPGYSPHSCLYFKTGAGKSVTALGMLFVQGYGAAVVICPPSTNEQWLALGEKLGIYIQCMSHAKFRMKGTKLERKVPIIADEFHLFGGHNGAGWKKLDRLAAGLQAPLILASATPNYNDAERVYCVKHVLNAASVRGGYIEFLYQNCTTEHDPFSMTPKVTGFHHYKDAAEFLAAQPNVFYLADDLVYDIEPHDFSARVLNHVDNWGYDAIKHKMIASAMEERHLRAYSNVVFASSSNDRRIRTAVEAALGHYIRASASPLLVFCAHSSIAEVLNDTFKGHLITGKTSTVDKARIISEFNAGKIPVLFGTASLATGTDGMDKVCHTLIIVDDTDDDALRRQLIGRIMPRGASNPVPVPKRVIRFEFV